MHRIALRVAFCNKAASDTGTAKQSHLYSQDLFALVQELQPDLIVNSWTSATKHDLRARHQFVIGPQRDINLPSGRGRLYYCYKCKWRFLVCGSKVAVLDEHGAPLIGDQAIERFSTLEEGPCPVMEAFAALMVAGDLLSASSQRESAKFDSSAPNHISALSGWSRPVRGLPTRVRKDLGGHDDLPDSDNHGVSIRLPADRDDPPRMVLVSKLRSLRRI